MDWITSNLGDLLEVVSKVIAVAAAVAAIVPSGGSASGVISALRKIVDVLALNVGNATNASNGDE